MCHNCFLAVFFVGACVRCVREWSYAFGRYIECWATHTLVSVVVMRPFNQVFSKWWLVRNMFNCFFSWLFRYWGYICSNMWVPISLSIISSVEMGSPTHSVKRVRRILIDFWVGQMGLLATPFLTRVPGPFTCLSWLFFSRGDYVL